MSDKPSREIVIYCDESDSKGKYYSNFYGGLLIESKNLLFVKKILDEKKLALNLYGEVKWNKITENYKEKYIFLIDALFKLIEEGYIKIRIMFTQNIYLPQNLTDYHLEHEYFLLYYQFLKYAFGLEHANTIDQPLQLRLYFDRLPNKEEKTGIFKSYLENLSLYTPFKKAKIIVKRDQIAEIESHAHSILQCLDIVLGAIQFRLNDKHIEKPMDSRLRGKRTVAKEEVYKYINARIRKIYPGFNIGKTTSWREEVKNIWLDPYRHWCFRPTDHIVDRSLGKKKRAKNNPALATLFSSLPSGT